VSVATALTAIRVRLLTITSPQSLIKVYADPKEATSLGEFPCAVLSLAPGVAHTWGTEAAGGGSGLAEHDYTVAIWLFVGALATPLPELHSRTIPWSEAIFRALVADIRLSGAVIQMGDGQSPALFTYQIGPMKWAKNEYFGVRVLLPIVEKPVVTMN
jgi:hypothetical protein